MKLLKELDKFSRTSIVLLALIQIIMLGVIDFYTGFELSFSVFYLVPVALTAWYSDKKTALLLSAISAVVWQSANLLAGETFQHFLIPIWNTSTRLGFFLIVSKLLTKLKESYTYQSNLAQTDFLTGAANPRAFYKALQMEILRSRRYHRTFTVCYFDADNFKKINDTLGHHIGSNLLVRVVEITKDTLRATDIIARLGGDEFAILLPETDERDARTVVKKLRETLLAEMKSNDWAVTFSIGVMTFSEAPENADEIIKVADSLMYEVKGDGKNAAKFSEYKNAESIQISKQENACI